jgi:hypothetical protein
VEQEAEPLYDMVSRVTRPWIDLAGVGLKVDWAAWGGKGQSTMKHHRDHIVRITVTDKDTPDSIDQKVREAVGRYLSDKGS